jgi:hypothetical protein
VFGAVATMRVLANGNLIVGGNLSGGPPSFQRIARWNGSAWAPIGGGLVGQPLAILELPNGDLLVAGNQLYVPGSAQAENLVRWNGTAWSNYSPGLRGHNTAGNYSFGATLRQVGNGEIVVGGRFRTGGGVVATHLTRLTTTCPAASVVTGAGCPSSGGSNMLVADLPWLASTWHSHATGLPAAALLFSVLGFSPTTLPLTAVFATAQAGCTLHVTPDRVDLGLANLGTAGAQFALPNTASLVGTVFHHQMVPLALDATLAVTATNALQMTVGAF